MSGAPARLRALLAAEVDSGLAQLLEDAKAEA